ncbi:MAG: ATP-binding protein [Coprothermobacterota bacterium]|nr:ATP-binding protein [Coprothermobacterota bacterium]
MRIAIASGKGGAGKTTVATNLAVLSAEMHRTVYVDCDVEEPNGGLFLKPTGLQSWPVELLVPRVEREKCLRCGLCAQICQFGALISLRGLPFIHQRLCHGCGGCAQVCSAGAIREEPRPIGTVVEGRAGELLFLEGRLEVGEAWSPQVIRALKKRIPRQTTAFLDAPPGTSCPVVTTLSEVDFVLLVCEPTPFGLHDLDLILHTVRAMNVPCGAFINRWEKDEDSVERFCLREGVPLLATLPDDRRIAEACSRGELLVHSLPEFWPLFVDLFTRLLERTDR